MLAPICVFTYNRLDETIKTIEALKRNFLAPTSELFIFSDGPKTEDDFQNVKDVRVFIRSVKGFKSIQIIESPVNKGLANSIIDGVTLIINEYGKVIVLEDDLVSSPNFLDFMNQALVFYSNNEKIFSITGYSMNLPLLKSYIPDYYLGFRACSWGWGTWKNIWQEVDWLVSDYNSFKRSIVKQAKFMRGGSDMPYMLWKQMNGKLDSWAIRWCYDQFKKEMFTVFPRDSKLINIGFGSNATNTKKTNRFHTILDKGSKTNFKFDKEPFIEIQLKKEFRQKFSIKNRLIDNFLP